MEPSSKPMQILVVDDDDVIVDLVREYFSVRGHQVHAAFDAREAIDVLQKEQLDVVLTDLRIPQGSGLDVVRAAGRLARPVASVLMTGLPTVDSAREAMQSGASDYITKPFRLRELFDAAAAAAAHTAALRERSLVADRCRLYELAWDLQQPNELPRLFGLLTQVARGTCGAEEVALWVRQPTGWTAVARGGVVRRLDGLDPLDELSPRRAADGTITAPVRRGDDVVAVLGVSGGRPRAPEHQVALSRYADMLARVLERLA